jgi:hypothetical protein
VAVLVTANINTGATVHSQVINSTSGVAGAVQELGSTFDTDPMGGFPLDVAFFAGANRLTILDSSPTLYIFTVDGNVLAQQVKRSVSTSRNTQLHVDRSGDIFYVKAGFLSYTVVKLNGTSGDEIWHTSEVGTDCGSGAATATNYYFNCGDDRIEIFDVNDGSHASSRTNGGALTFMWPFYANSEYAAMSFSQYVDKKDKKDSTNSGFGVVGFKGTQQIWNVIAAVQDQSALTFSGEYLYVWYSGVVLNAATGKVAVIFPNLSQYTPVNSACVDGSIVGVTETAYTKMQMTKFTAY